ncbi:MAG: hypothetical protein CMA10_04575 [Euryarchaeota archaeon]|nr:hypothetical protein [Euryarchaeota archaeon]|tara:strand:+ start:388 stop:1281 length:894 start_codon:yes stop_codon:yes gene_type:complete
MQGWTLERFRSIADRSRLLGREYRCRDPVLSRPLLERMLTPHEPPRDKKALWGKVVVLLAVRTVQRAWRARTPRKCPITLEEVHGSEKFLLNGHCYSVSGLSEYLLSSADFRCPVTRQKLSAEIVLSLAARCSKGHKLKEVYHHSAALFQEKIDQAQMVSNLGSEALGHVLAVRDGGELAEEAGGFMEREFGEMMEREFGRLMEREFRQVFTDLWRIDCSDAQQFLAVALRMLLGPQLRMPQKRSYRARLVAFLVPILECCLELKLDISELARVLGVTVTVMRRNHTAHTNHTNHTD